VAGLLVAGVVAIVFPLGLFSSWFGGPGLWSHLFPFAAAVLCLGFVIAIGMLGWFVLRRRLVSRFVHGPVVLASIAGAVALWFATGTAFRDEAVSLRLLLGGRAAAERRAIAHQVYAAYRRQSPVDLTRMFERARPYESVVQEAADAFGVDVEVLMGVAAAESSFRPRTSMDGGVGLFQITQPPSRAALRVKKRLGARDLDRRDHRQNAYLGAATLGVYLDEMSGDLFLALLAYNMGPRNGGLRAVMERYGARDFVTIQPYLTDLPRDYPIRVLAAALAYRLWRREGRLPAYEEGDNARRIQEVGIPGVVSPDGLAKLGLGGYGGELRALRGERRVRDESG
jgi:hypothetical protein